MKANMLLEEDFGLLDSWGTKDSVVYKERLKSVRNLSPVHDLSQDLAGGGALANEGP